MSFFKGRTFLLTGVVLFLCLLLIWPQRAISGATEGLVLWYRSVLPAQLPFVIAVRLLLALNIQGGVFLSILVGMIAGYPMGALTADYLCSTGAVARERATPLAALTNLPGPSFVISTVGVTLLGSTTLGYLLLLICWLSSALLLFLFYILSSEQEKNQIVQQSIKSCQYIKEKKPFGRLLSDAVSEGAELMIRIGGFIVLFSVILQFISSPFGVLLEITGGLKWITQHVSSMPWKLMLCSFLLGFSGVCVIAQSLAVTDSQKIQSGRFVLYKLLQGITGATLMGVICQFLTC